MEIKRNNKCVKIQLPNGSVVDVLSAVLDEVFKWIQIDANKPESGGYIVGYEHERTGHISLEEVSHPYSLDTGNRIHFDIRDPLHNLFLKKARRRKSYYMGVWHTHPQSDPTPSAVDWEDWSATMQSDKTGSQYIFFIIVGTVKWRIWIGDFSTGKIVEGLECLKNADSIYIKEGEDHEEEYIRFH